MSVQLKVRVQQSDYLIRCPDGAHQRAEVGQSYVVMPSPFEVDEPEETLWLSVEVVVERARAGDWGLFLISEMGLSAEVGGPTQTRPPVASLNAHKVIDQRRRNEQPSVAGTRGNVGLNGSKAPSR